MRRGCFPLILVQSRFFVPKDEGWMNIDAMRDELSFIFIHNQFNRDALS